MVILFWSIFFSILQKLYVKTLLLIGPHEINIFKDGIKTIGSPIIIHVSDPNLVKVDNLLRESKVNQPFAFNIDASKAGEGFIRVNIKGNRNRFKNIKKKIV